jgi:hypothetical protein
LRQVYLGGGSSPHFSGCDLAVSGGRHSEKVPWVILHLLVEIVLREAKTFQRIIGRAIDEGKGREILD